MIKDVLKSARKRKGLTQEQVAKEVKVAKQTYLKWENGDTEPRASQIWELANTLSVSPTEICSGQEISRMELREFLTELSGIAVPREMITLLMWEELEDHNLFLSKLETYEKELM